MFVLEPKCPHQSTFLLGTFGFEKFGRSMSYFGMFFKNLGLAILLLNNHIGLKLKKL